MEEMPKTYDPQEVEPKLIETWIAAGAYQRSADKGVGDCTVTIPPPNVTGMLHMGHALDDTIQDTLVRYKRMQGFSTRWILGTDHAGIATQTKVDKKLKEEGVSRLEIGREKFIDACWDWTHEYGGIIVDQIKRMGCSIDFDDEKFTMDPEYALAVRKVFCDWYHDGLIYRGKRIVNWCPNCTTAISDDEAEYRDEDSHLWHLRYPLTEPVDGVEYIVVTTSRPETMLGDSGVAVSPSDPEKAKFVGKTVMLPIVNREIPIFADWHVDADFGSGFVKATPAHDPNDYAMGQAHGLEQINIFDEHAVVVEGYGEFTGMNRDEARAAVVAWFEEHGLLDHVDDINHSVMHCYRCDAALEPWLSEQWFVAVDKLKGPATDVVKNGQVTFHPERWTQTYLTWMENLKDWCISRQLWWGHRIPVFYCDECGWEDACMDDVAVCPKCGKPVHQDENVLDTWFSSQLWTFATQGWPLRPEEMEGHHPTTALVTARDIIALWVARMVMSSLYFTEQIPFHDVVIYPTILAKDGSRMSKSKGNGVDPMDLMAMYGADAMRFGLLGLVTSNQDVRFDADIDKKTKQFLGSPRTENAKAFVTKIYNASRFVLSNLDEGFVPGAPAVQTGADAWIFSRLGKLAAEVNQHLDAYEYAEYVRALYAFFWNEFCDWYIECCKAPLRAEGEARAQVQRNLVFVLDRALRLLHPVMPFVTEFIWDQMPHEAGEEAELLMLSTWPKAGELASWIDEEAERSFELLRAVVGSARSTRARYAISPKQELAVTVRAQAADVARLEAQGATVCEMGRLSALTVAADAAKPAGSVMTVDAGLEIYIELADLVDLAAESARLTKQLEAQKKELAGVEKTLANPGFVAKAAPEVIEEKRARVSKLTESIAVLEAQIRDLA